MAYKPSFAIVRSQPNPNLAGLRRFRRDIADTASGAGTATDIVVIGDSIAQGYNAGAAKSWVNVTRAELKRLYGFPVGGIGHRHFNSSEYDAPKPVAFGTAADQNGVGLSGRAGAIPYSATQANGFTATTTYDRVLVNYAATNTFGASFLYIADSSSGVLTTAIGTFDGALPTFTYRSDGLYDSGALGAAASRTLTVATATNASFTSGATVCGAYFLSGEGAGDVRVWNGGRFGATTATMVQTRNWTDLAAGLGAALVILEVGINNTGAASYVNGLTAIVAQINAQYVAAGKLAPGYLIMPFPAANGRSTADATQYRAGAYNVADQIGAAVFDWFNLVGDVGSGDPLGLTTDGTHPNNRGHRLIGEALARFLFTGSPT